MGRKTWESIPIDKRPLKNRINIVFTSTEINNPNVYSVSNIDQYLKLENELSRELNNVFVIGGEQIYNLFMNQGDH